MGAFKGLGVLTGWEIEKLFARQEQLEKAHPKCPKCASDQIQIMSKAVPAEWRCRICKHDFTFEPGSP